MLSFLASVQMLPSDLHRNSSNTPCCCYWGKSDVAASAPSQTANCLDRSHPGGWQLQPHMWENMASKEGKRREPGCNTRPLPFTSSFWGLQAGLFTQVQQSRNTCSLFQPGITPELINLADQSWLSALWFWKHDADKWKLALERASVGLGFINLGFAPCKRVKSGPRD